MPAERDQALATVQALIGDLIELDVECVVVAIPGLLRHDGCLVKALYSPISGVNIRDVLELSAEPAVVSVVNDANLQAIGLAKPSARSHLHIALGTAVGGSVVASGSVMEGEHGFAGEIGHIRSSFSNRLCPCGRTGCVDTLLSGWSLENDLGKMWWTTAPSSRRTYERLTTAGHALGNAVADMNSILDLSEISIAGHLAANHDFRTSFASALSNFEVAVPVQYTDTWSAAARGAQIKARVIAPA